jgi:hypothetical protein
MIDLTLNKEQINKVVKPQLNRPALLNPQRGSRRVGKFHGASI